MEIKNFVNDFGMCGVRGNLEYFRTSSWFFIFLGSYGVLPQLVLVMSLEQMC